MSYVRMMPNGKWRAEIARDGSRKSKVFITRQEAKDWASHEEYAILNEKKIKNAILFSEVMQRYANEVSPQKKGARWEQIRLNALAKDRIGEIKISELAPEDIADWRDRRLRDVLGASVNREMTLLSSVLTMATREWRLCSRNVMRDVTRPKGSKPRTRVSTNEEIERIREVVGSDLTTVKARSLHAYLFACETAMRCGEIASLTWKNVNLEERWAHLPVTKTGYERTVALTREAVRLLEELPKMEPVFGVSASVLSATFQKVKKEAGVKGLTFHDSRREGTTKLARKLEPLELGKMTGHRDLSLLMNTYYKEDISKIANKLD